MPKHYVTVSFVLDCSESANYNEMLLRRFSQVALTNVCMAGYVKAELPPGMELHAPSVTSCVPVSERSTSHRER